MVGPAQIVDAGIMAYVLADIFRDSRLNRFVMEYIIEVVDRPFNSSRFQSIHCQLDGWAVSRAIEQVNNNFLIFKLNIRSDWNVE